MSDETASLPPVKITWLIGVFAAFTIFAFIAGYSGHMTRVYPSYDQQRAADRILTLQKVRADEDKILNGPADWIDQTKQTVHIPIEEAMAKEIDVLKSQPAHICTPLTPPGMAATPPTPAATAPANSAPAAPSTPAKPNK